MPSESTSVAHRGGFRSVLVLAVVVLGLLLSASTTGAPSDLVEPVLPAAEEVAPEPGRRHRVAAVRQRRLERSQRVRPPASRRGRRPRTAVAPPTGTDAPSSRPPRRGPPAQA